MDYDEIRNKLPDTEYDYGDSVFADMASEIKSEIRDATDRKIEVLKSQISVQTGQLSELEDANRQLKSDAKYQKRFTYLSIVISFTSLVIALFSLLMQSQAIGR